MGLDMYINKIKKVDDLTLKEIMDVYDYIDWKKNGTKYSFREWCGGNENNIRKEYVEAVSKLIHIDKHPAWSSGDYENECESIEDNVAYWRKANQIHNWFVKNVQNGEDDCGAYLLSKDQIEELLDIVTTVIRSCNLVNGKIINGYSFKNGKEVVNWIDGKIIKDPTVAKNLLPCTSGFFFGSTEYDEWYYNDLIETLSQLNKILIETDFDKEYLFYHASW